MQRNLFMNFAKIQKIQKSKKQCYDITINNNHNFFANDCLIHNCDYKGSVGVILANFGQDTFVVENNMRIAQMVFANVLTPTIELCDELSETERGQGGFGSTGL